MCVDIVEQTVANAAMFSRGWLATATHGSSIDTVTTLAANSEVVDLDVEMVAGATIAGSHATTDATSAATDEASNNAFLMLTIASFAFDAQDLIEACPHQRAGTGDAAFHSVLPAASTESCSATVHRYATAGHTHIVAEVDILVSVHATSDHTSTDAIDAMLTKAASASEASANQFGARGDASDEFPGYGSVGGNASFVIALFEVCSASTTAHLVFASCNEAALAGMNDCSVAHH